MDEIVILLLNVDREMGSIHHLLYLVLGRPCLHNPCEPTLVKLLTSSTCSHIASHVASLPVLLKSPPLLVFRHLDPPSKTHAAQFFSPALTTHTPKVDGDATRTPNPKFRFRFRSPPGVTRCDGTEGGQGR
jgi:hypothetical protein